MVGGGAALDREVDAVMERLRRAVVCNRPWHRAADAIAHVETRLKVCRGG